MKGWLGERRVGKVCKIDTPLECFAAVGKSLVKG